jgi:hypothetical protein
MRGSIRLVSGAVYVSSLSSELLQVLVADYQSADGLVSLQGSSEVYSRADSYSSFLQVVGGCT